MKFLVSITAVVLGAAAFFAVDGLMPSTAEANTLYEAGPGLYGGRAYKDSEGNYWNEDTRYVSGKYGGGTLIDRDGNTLHCSTSGNCTPY